MDAVLVDSAMLKEMDLQLPLLSSFFIFNFFCSVFTAVYCLRRFLVNDYIVTRVSFCFVALVCLFYQVPLTLFSSSVESSLDKHWAYSLSVNGGALLLVAWGMLSKRWDLRRIEASYFSERIVIVYLVTGLLGGGLLWSYLSAVPWECTGLYALMYDPWLTLLAREFSVKLIGTSFSTYALGAYANAVAPALVLLSVFLVRVSLSRGQYLLTIVGLSGGFLAIVAVLISGTKGLLLPSVMMLIVGNYLFFKAWILRFTLIFLSVLLVFLSLVTFEQMKERPSNVGGKYDFAVCSAKLGTCEASIELIRSMAARDHSLGIPSRFVSPIQSRLEMACGVEVAEGEADYSVSGDVFGVPSSERPSELIGVESTTSMSSMGVIERTLNFVGAVFRRVFVVPFQVSVWHFMYSESEVVDGLKTLPFARRLLGDSLNMPELVYQKYGTVYSQGDKTSTSTAPTSFFLTYPAYLGWLGLVLAFIGIVVLDTIVAMMARFSASSVVPILAGMVAITTMNFMSSDYVTVLVSHGAVAGFFLIAIYTLLLKNKQ